MTRVLVNGRPDGVLTPLDRGLQYGDGLFETFAVRGGAARLFGLHLERLAEGCRRLRLEPPPAAVLEREIAAVAPVGQAVAKLILTRGPAGRGYRIPAASQPTRIVAGFEPGPAPAWHHGGLRAITCRTRLGRNPALAGIKHLGRLEQVLARSEWSDATIAEGLMLDDAGQLVCGTQSNLFAFVGGELVTPAVDECGVAGVMRRALLEWATRRGLAVRVTRLRPEALAAAGEVLLTNALAGAQPLAELDARPLPEAGIAREFDVWLHAG